MLRLPMLQTCKADGLTAGSLVPTRLVTLAAVTGGLSSDAQRRAVDEGKVCSMCRVDFGQPAATSTRARVIVNGCCHSYCKRCLSDLFIEARGEDFFCRHSSCRNRLQLGFLRELVDRGTYEASSILEVPRSEEPSHDGKAKAASGGEGEDGESGEHRLSVG